MAINAEGCLVILGLGHYVALGYGDGEGKFGHYWASGMWRWRGG